MDEMYIPILMPCHAFFEWLSEARCVLLCPLVSTVVDDFLSVLLSFYRLGVSWQACENLCEHIFYPVQACVRLVKACVYALQVRVHCVHAYVYALQVRVHCIHAYVYTFKVFFCCVA